MKNPGGFFITLLKRGQLAQDRAEALVVVAQEDRDLFAGAHQELQIITPAVDAMAKRGGSARCWLCKPERPARIARPRSARDPQTGPPPFPVLRPPERS